MNEMRDRWRQRLTKSPGIHGRLAVVLSSAMAALLLVLGGVLFAASQDSRKPTNLAGPTHTAVSSKTTDPGAMGTLNKTLTDSGSDTTAVTPAEPNTTTTVAPSGGPATTATTATTGRPAPTVTSPSSPATTVPPAPTTATTETTVTPREVPANGPALPSVVVDPSSDTEDPNLSLKIDAGDRDGYVSRITVDWNDQTPQSVITYALSACTEPLSSAVNTTAAHVYDTAGSYTVTVTVTSVSCAGDGEQSSIGVARVSVGGNTPASSSTTPAA